MRLALISIVAVVALLAGNTTTQAAPILPGDIVRLADGPGTTGGGEFYLTVNGDPTTTFISFCVQRTEYINFTSPFTVDAVSTYAISDPASNGGDALGRDYLSPQTAYLYTMFRAGTLTGYNYTPGTFRVASANSLQNAIWMFEQELPMNTSNPFVVLANNAVSTGAWSGLGDVRALNLSYSNGIEAQDQLAIQEVPEGASLTMLLCGLGVVFAGQRFRIPRLR